MKVTYARLFTAYLQQLCRNTENSLVLFLLLIISNTIYSIDRVNYI